MPMWLLEASVKKRIERAQDEGFTPTADQQATVRVESDIMVSAGTSAEISIQGVLTNRPDFMARIFGGGNVTYPAIIAALAEADSDPSVKDITLAIDSPGGEFQGLFDVLAAIEATKKPINAVISGMGASAAFAIASQADTITATNIASRIGSIGVVASFFVDEDVVDVTSTEAPNKRPDVTTTEGVAAVREELDAMHDIFVDAISAGRGTTVKDVNANFGRGATLLAGEALKRGMIDSIAKTPLKSVKSNRKPKAGATAMDQKEIQTQFPVAYAAIVAEGVTQERDRVTAHLVMGEMSGDVKTANTSIKEGSEMTATLNATYMMAAVNRRDIDNREGDNSDTSNLAAPTEADAKVKNANALSSVAELCGVDLGAQA